MPFGIKSAPEEFQRHFDESLEGFENIAVIHDDIVIFGYGDSIEEATSSHELAFRALLDRCRERELKLNKKKLRFKLNKVAYMGHVLGADGLQADPEKITAIREMPRSTDVQGVQRLIGVVTYLSKFLPQLGTVCEPLRRLTVSQAVFDWLPQREEAFIKIKELVTQAPVLRYCDVNKEVTIEFDSSDVGLGAVLTQDSRPVAYASSTLTQTERNYAQIEKECLAIVFAAERFEHYLLGKDIVKVLSDHKPLMSIFAKSVLKSPKRLQRMRLRLRKYPLKVVYKPGPQMFISDTLSRAALPPRRTQTDTPYYLIFQLHKEERFRQEVEETSLEEATIVTDQCLEQIRQETSKDATVQTLINLITAGWPRTHCKAPFAFASTGPTGTNCLLKMA